MKNEALPEAARLAALQLAETTGDVVFVCIVNRELAHGVAVAGNGMPVDDLVAQVLEALVNIRRHLILSGGGLPMKPTSVQ